MAVNIEQGVLGLEARWHINGLLFHNTSTGLPRYKFTKISNLHSLPDAEDVAVAVRGRIGETPYPVENRGKTITFEGRIEANNLLEMREYSDILRAYTYNRSGLVEIQSVPSSVLAVGGTAEDGWFGNGRIVTLEMDELQEFAPTRSPSPYMRSFLLGFRMYDPRWYLRGSGGLVQEAGETDTGTVINLGSAPSDPVVTVENVGSGDEVTINRETDDDFFSLAFTAAASGTLTVNFKKRTAKIDGTDTSGGITWDISDWWDEGVAGMPPGESIVSQSGAGGPVTVTFRHAAW